MIACIYTGIYYARQNPEWGIENGFVTGEGKLMRAQILGKKEADIKLDTEWKTVFQISINARLVSDTIRFLFQICRANVT